MRTSRIYLPIDANSFSEQLVIQQEKAHYIRNVLRLKVGQALNFFIPAGVEYQAVITAINKHDVTLSNILPLNQPAPSSQLSISLVQGISSSDRMDYSIQKAAELGCVRMTPVLTDFCSSKVPKHKQAKKLQHWQAVAISASEQSGRCDVMTVTPIQALSEVIKATTNGFYLEPDAATHVHQLPAAMQTAPTVFIGPEGGFSPAEIEAFEQQQLLGVQLGQRVLRTETVAPVVLACLHTLYGDFKPPAE